jgi:hypothetical protein
MQIVPCARHPAGLVLQGGLKTKPMKLDYALQRLTVSVCVQPFSIGSFLRVGAKPSRQAPAQNEQIGVRRLRPCGLIENCWRVFEHLAAAVVQSDSV